jgi:hypothetical protein
MDSISTQLQYRSREQRNRVSVQPRVSGDIRNLETVLPIIRDKWHLIISPL